MSVQSAVGGLNVERPCSPFFFALRHQGHPSSKTISRSAAEIGGAGEAGDILWVEDDREFAEQLLQIWRGALPIARVSGSREAMSRTDALPPRLILLDLTLPHFLAETDDLEGVRLLDYFRQQPRRIPVVVLTGETSARVHEYARRHGADAVVVKGGSVGEIEELSGTAPGGKGTRSGRARECLFK